MSRNDWVCVGIMILGIVLFLYGANYYDNVVGWTGLYFVVGGFVALVLLAVYNTLKPAPSSEGTLNPAPEKETQSP